MCKKVIKITIMALLGILLVFVLAVVSIFVYITRTDEVENICDGVILLDTTTKDTGPIINKLFALIMDKYDIQGRCSTAVKVLNNGDLIIGRNMDMELSNYPIYIGRTEIEGFYPTIYASELEDLGVTYASCIEKGIPKYMSAIAPYIATDVLNSEGLYMEMNLRVNQKDEDGNFALSVSGTNKNASVRVSLCELCTYVTMRCKNVEEALALIYDIDIYSQVDEYPYLLSYIIADADGNYGLLEFCKNEIRWISEQSIQTNFYVSEDFKTLQKYAMGIGRYEYLEENLDSVETEDDMLKLMEGVKYSEIYNLDNPSYDIRSEFVGDEEYLTNDYLENDDNWAAYMELLQEEVDFYHSASREELKDAYYFWNSLYTSIVNVKQKRISFSFFEEYEITYTLSFE